MKKFPLFLMAGAVLFLLGGGLAQQAGAQVALGSPSQAATAYAARVAKVCPGTWEAQACLEALSESALVLASNYAAALQGGGHAQQVELIKEHCAAATAATQGEFPAYAMREAFVECANIMVDTSDQTGVAPDASHYQLLIKKRALSLL